MSKQTKREMMQDVENVVGARIVANNTVEYNTTNGSRVIRLHNTNIVMFLKDGRVVLNSGGWKTATTKERINRYLPDGVNLWQERGAWYVGKRWEKNDSSLFYDGMKLRNGKVVSPRAKYNRNVVLLKSIAKYCKALKELPSLPDINPGDCWHCMMRVDGTDTPLGDAMKDTDHLHSHLKEMYIHGSLIWNALVFAGYQKPEYILHMNLRESVVRAVRRYFKRKLGLPS